jgi:hypothetical protein
MTTRSVAFRGSDRGFRFTAVACAFSCSLALGCSDDGGDDDADSPGISVHAEISEAITTVVRVTWTTPDADNGHVEYGTTEALGMTTPATTTAAAEQSELLLGLPPDTEYFYRVVTASGKKSAIKSDRTGFLPPWVPTIEVVGEGHDRFVSTTVLGANNAAIVLDRNGQIVWYKKDESGLQVFRSRLSRDGKSILYNAVRASGEPSPDSAIVRVSLDGTETRSVTVPYLAHDFVELPDGTLAAVVVDQRDVDGTDVKSNAIVEVTPDDGEVTEVWNALDCFDPAVDVGSEPEQGWTLANALDYDETDDVYYFGSRGLSNISRIPRGMRECEWVLGSTGNTIDFAEGSAVFLHQHQFEVLGDHVIVHDNDGTMERASRIVEYRLDLTAGTATEVWSFMSTPPVYAPILGEPIRLDGGETFIDWSYAGQLERVTPDGETTWKVNTRAGGVFGYATLFESFYQ